MDNTNTTIAIAPLVDIASVATFREPSSVHSQWNIISLAKTKGDDDDYDDKMKSYQSKSLT